MWEKKKGITECDKSTVTCDVGIAQFHNGTVKCKEKLKYYQIWEKYDQIWCWYCSMWQWNYQMWEKNKWTTKCDKSTVTCDVVTAQCENSIIKFEKKSRNYWIWEKYSRMWYWYYTM